MDNRKRFPEIIWKNLSKDQLEAIEEESRRTGRSLQEVAPEVLVGQTKL